MRFNSILLVFLFLLSLFSCSDTFFYRAGADYFPLTPDSRWKYLVGDDTIEVKVDTLPAVMLNQNCIRVYRNAAPEYYRTSPFEIKRLVINTLPRPNAPDTVEYRFILLYQLPFVVGNIYFDRFDTTLIYGPDTVQYSHLIIARIAALEQISVGADNYHDCYRIEFTEKKLAFDTTETAWSEWLAPGIGVVRRQTAQGDEILVEYQP
ncbi:MAG: hypothetical protein ACUVUD_02390 [bacterium]